jgi:hypothetical protein
MAVSSSTRAEEKLAQIQNWPHWSEIGLLLSGEYQARTKWMWAIESVFWLLK